MKKAIITLLAVLAGTWTFAVDYHYIGNNVKWAAASSWDNGTSFPNSASAVAYIQNGKTLNWSLDTQPPNILAGAIIIDNVSTIRNDNLSPAPITITTDASQGKSGDFWFRSGVFNAYRIKPTFNIAGNLYLNNTFANSWGQTWTFNMNGNNKGFTLSTAVGVGAFTINVNGVGVFDNSSSTDPFQAGNANGNSLGNWTVTVAPGGSIAANPNGSAGWWKARKFVFQGGQSNLPALGANVDFVQGYVPGADNGPAGKVWVTGNVTYPRDLWVGHPYSGNGQKNAANLRIQGGNLGVGRDLILQRFGNQSYETWVDTLDNNNGVTSRNVTVDRDLTIAWASSQGGVNSGGTTDRYGMRLNASTVKVGEDLILGGTGTSASDVTTSALNMGSANVSVGRDFQLRSFPGSWTISNWSAGTSTVTCDGNGTAYHYTQTLRLYGDCGINLNNLKVNNAGGIVQLFNGVGGGLKLSGNLEIDCGTFTGNKQNIIFNGPSHTLTNFVNPGTYQFDDNINLFASSVLLLGSDIAIKSGDNLNMGAGSIIYLFGHVLKADGKTYDGTLSGMSWTNDGGTIYALSNVPEPATLMTLGSAALAAVGWMRRRRVS